MRVRNNEHGGALAMVLLLIVVFTVLGMSLLIMNISATKQFSKKGEQVQARHQAEMGLLHYAAEINEELKSSPFVKSVGETEIETLEKNQTELCRNLKTIAPPSISENSRGYITNEVKDCEIGEDGKLLVEVYSKGTSKETTKEIIGTAIIAPPIISKEENNLFQKPDRPGGYNPKSDLPEDTPSYVEVYGPVVTKKETQSYGTLVINKAPNNQITFRVDGGNGYKLTVAKNFYIGGNVDSQNHSCMTVKGDLTILGTSYLGNKSMIFVYGNAYFEKEPTLHNGNSGIYVAGNTFVGNPPVKTNKYKAIPSFQDCDKPNDFQNPYEPGDSMATVYQWKLENELHPIYN